MAQSVNSSPLDFGSGHDLWDWVVGLSPMSGSGSAQSACPSPLCLAPPSSINKQKSETFFNRILYKSTGEKNMPLVVKFTNVQKMEAVFTKIINRGTWVAQWVKCQTLGFGLRSGSQGREIEPCAGLQAGCAACLRFSFSFTTHSLSKKRKISKEKKKELL